MKNLIILFLILLSSYANSQSKTQIGFKLGGSFSSLLNAKSPERTNLKWYSENPYFNPLLYDFDDNIFKNISSDGFIGFTFIDNSFKKISIGAELLITTSGMNINDQRTSIQTVKSSSGNEVILQETRQYNFIRKINNTYLQIPVWMRYYLDKKRSWYAMGGVYIGILLKSSINVKDEESAIYKANGFIVPLPFNKSFSYEGNAPLSTTNADNGIVLGFGKNIFLNERISINPECRLNLGLQKIGYGNNKVEDLRLTDKKTITFSDYQFGLNSNSKNINLSLSIGVMYSL
jgi:Outer membrane protein beta-barrel domain